jgi:hypothetical protein
MARTTVVVITVGKMDISIKVNIHKFDIVDVAIEVNIIEVDVATEVDVANEACVGIVVAVAEDTVRYRVVDGVGAKWAAQLVG